MFLLIQQKGLLSCIQPMFFWNKFGKFHNYRTCRWTYCKLHVQVYVQRFFTGNLFLFSHELHCISSIMKLAKTIWRPYHCNWCCKYLLRNTITSYVMTMYIIKSFVHHYIKWYFWSFDYIICQRCEWACVCECVHV